jgi:hypothetical protein
MEFRLPWDDLPAPKARAPKPEQADAQPAPVRKQSAAKKRSQQTADAAGIGWQWWHVVVHGPAEEVTAFAAAAQGPGAIPWPYDGAMLEEEVFLYAIGGAGPRSLSIAECRVQARQFRDAVEARQVQTIRSPESGRRCPFDLHSLLPIPTSILRLGIRNPQAEAWLTENWGVIDQPRQAVILETRTAGKRLPRGHESQVYGFFTEGAAPEPAVIALRQRWDRLAFRLNRQPMT